MSIGNALGYIGIVVFLFGIWQTYDKRNKVWIVYTGVGKTLKKGWVKITADNKVIFDNKQFDVLPECITSIWIRDGIHILFPIWAKSMQLYWYSRYPVDPTDYKRSWDSPDLRNMLNLQDILRSFFRNFTPPKSQKLGGLQQYLPYIAIFLVLIVGFYLYSNMESMKQVINMMQNQINTVTPR